MENELAQTFGGTPGNFGTMLTLEDPLFKGAKIEKITWRNYVKGKLYGKLSDMYGRRPFYLFAIAVFVVGSALCGMAQSMYELAAFRAFQGIGAGGLMSLALAIIADIVPPRERSKYQGYFMAVFGTSSVLGPVIGGFLSGT